MAANYSIMSSSLAEAVGSGLAYGEMGEVNESGTNIVVTTGGNPTGTFYGWVTATADAMDPNSNVTWANNSTADRLVIGTNGAGVYRVSVMCSASTTASREIQMCVHVNDTPDVTLRCDTTGNGTGNDTVTIILGFVTLAATDFVDLRFSSSVNSTTIVLKHVNMTLERIR